MRIFCHTVAINLICGKWQTRNFIFHFFPMKATKDHLHHSRGKSPNPSPGNSLAHSYIFSQSKATVSEILPTFHWKLTWTSTNRFNIIRLQTSNNGSIKACLSSSETLIKYNPTKKKQSTCHFGIAVHVNDLYVIDAWGVCLILGVYEGTWSEGFFKKRGIYSPL